jgi:protein required for attachment to host cells
LAIQTWIIIADGARAHIVCNDGIGKGVTPVLDRDLKSAWVPTRALGTDRPGRTFESADSSRHAMEPRVDWHRFEKHQFVEKMAKLVNKAASRRTYDRLVLVAPPEILGVLRAALSEPAKKRVVAELAKDLTSVPVREIPERLRDVVNL